MRQNIGKNLKIALTFLVIGSILGSLTVFAINPSSKYYISSGVYPAIPSYTIWKEGSNYFAKDRNGFVAYSGSNASEIIQNSIDSSVTGVIYLRKADYIISTTIIASQDIKIMGEDRYFTILNGQLDVNPVIRSPKSVNLENLRIVSYNYTLVLGVASSPSIIKDCAFYYGRGLLLNGTEYLTMQGCYFYKAYAGYCALNLASNGAGYLANHNMFRDCAFKSNDGYSVYLNGGQGNLFQGCGFEGNTEIPIYIKDGDFNTFSSCWIEGNSGTANCVIEKGKGNQLIEKCTFSGTQTDIVIGNESETARDTQVFECYFHSDHTHIEIGSNGLYTSIQGNRFRNSSPILDSGTGTYRMFNDGYTYGYSIATGTQASVSDTNWVSYGLTFGESPQVIILTPHTNVGVCVLNRNTTHFQVGVATGSTTIDWLAEYKP